MRACWLLFAVGCGKQLNPEFCAAHPDDLRCAASDATQPDGDGKLDVAHLSAVSEGTLTNTEDVTIVSATTIDTRTGMVMPSPGGLIISSIAQESGPDVMVLQGANITLGADVTIVGNQPLIIVALRDFTVSAVVDAAANMQTPGPGGGPPGMGPGVGAIGGGGNGNSDSGGGGGSFGSLGGIGGDVDGRTGGNAGTTYGDATSLQGGSGGGRGATPGFCPPPMAAGGAGGGAIQLTAGGTLTIDGSIHAGGGGGTGAAGCNNDGAAGSGGGSGGTIFLQARAFAGTGTLAANGGGGSGGGSGSGTTPGDAGTNATVTGGGTGGNGGNSGGRGGDGASGAGVGQDGDDSTSADQNGGGGGGGAGHIFFKGPQPSYVSSPPAKSA